MPELPEVETTRRGIEPSVVGTIIERSSCANRACAGACRATCRSSLQGSASTAIAPARQVSAVRSGARHDDPAPGHVGQPARAAGDDARRCRTITSISCSTPACACASTIRVASAACCGRQTIRCMHPLLRVARTRTAVGLNSMATTLARAAKGRRVAIKQLMMNSQVVVGVGNIYASEALFRAGIRPRRAAGRLEARRIRRAG